MCAEAGGETHPVTCHCKRGKFSICNYMFLGWPGAAQPELIKRHDHNLLQYRSPVTRQSCTLWGFIQLPVVPLIRALFQVFHKNKDCITLHRFHTQRTQKQQRSICSVPACVKNMYVTAEQAAITRATACQQLHLNVQGGPASARQATKQY